MCSQDYNTPARLSFRIEPEMEFPRHTKIKGVCDGKPGLQEILQRKGKNVNENMKAGNTKAVKAHIAIKKKKSVMALTKGFKIGEQIPGEQIPKTWGGEELRMGSHLNDHWRHRDCYCRSGRMQS